MQQMSYTQVSKAGCKAEEISGLAAFWYVTHIAVWCEIMAGARDKGILKKKVLIVTIYLYRDILKCMTAQ